MLAQHGRAVSRCTAAQVTVAAAVPVAACRGRSAAARRHLLCYCSSNQDSGISISSSPAAVPLPAAPAAAPSSSTPPPPTPPQQQQQPQHDSIPSNPLAFTDAELRQLWDSVSRSLLKLGKAGLSDTHVSSLSELLSAHKLIKVDLNAAKDEAAVAAAAADIVKRVKDTGVLIQVKGRTLLLGSSSSSKEELLALAEAATASTAVWKAKRQMKKAEAAAKKGPAGQQR